MRSNRTSHPSTNARSFSDAGGNAKPVRAAPSPEIVTVRFGASSEGDDEQAVTAGSNPALATSKVSAVFIFMSVPRLRNSRLVESRKEVIAWTVEDLLK